MAGFVPDGQLFVEGVGCEQVVDELGDHQNDRSENHVAQADSQFDPVHGHLPPKEGAAAATTIGAAPSAGAGGAISRRSIPPEVAAAPLVVGVSIASASHVAGGPIGGSRRPAVGAVARPPGGGAAIVGSARGVGSAIVVVVSGQDGLVGGSPEHGAHEHVLAVKDPEGTAVGVPAPLPVLVALPRGRHVGIPGRLGQRFGFFLVFSCRLAGHRHPQLVFQGVEGGLGNLNPGLAF